MPENNSESVSKFLETGSYESNYFNVRINSQSNELQSNFRILQFYLVLADIYRDKCSIDSLQEQFSKIVEYCKENDNEIKALNDALSQCSNIGGYAKEFYENNKTIINKENEEGKVNAENSQEDKPVSFKIPNGYESKYFNVKHKFEPLSELGMACDSLGTYLCFADVSRADRSIKRLKEKYLTLISECKTEDDKRKLEDFMRDCSNIGGYAHKFLEENFAFIYDERATKDELNKIMEEKAKPVSHVVNGKFTSEYFRLESSSSYFITSFIINLAKLDASRTSENMRKAVDSFYKVLLECKNENDYYQVRSLVDILADIGGYAIEFKKGAYNRINDNGKREAQEYYKQKSGDYKEKKEKNERVEEFKQKYKVLNRRLQEFKGVGNVDTDELDVLLSRYNKLKSELYDIKDLVEYKYIYESDEDISKKIRDLRDLRDSLEEIHNFDFSL